MTWQPYLNNRLIKKCEGWFFIKPEDHDESEVTPISCPVCEFLMRTSEDEKSFRQFSCCETCEVFWARPNQEQWKSGWRPNKLEIEKKFGKKEINVSINL